jgi:hypothetical protein
VGCVYTIITRVKGELRASVLLRACCVRVDLAYCVFSSCALDVGVGCGLCCVVNIYCRISL